MCKHLCCIYMLILYSVQRENNHGSDENSSLRAGLRRRGLENSQACRYKYDIKYRTTLPTLPALCAVAILSFDGIYTP